LTTIEARSGDHLTWGGCDCLELAATYGTPLYVMDESMIRAIMRRYRDASRRAYADLRVAYAGKAFLCGAIVRAVADEGLWLDVVSGGELHLALAGGMDPGRIIFHGNNKSPDELALGLRAGVGRFVIDNAEELERLAVMARDAGGSEPPKVLIRVTPGISPRTHRAVQTGQVDSKFGFPIAGGAALAAVRRVLELGSLQLAGLHSHIGSQIKDLHPFQAEARAVARFAWAIWEATGYLVSEVNLGGGWAAGLPSSETVDPIETYIDAVTAAFRSAWRRHGRPGIALGKSGISAAAGPSSSRTYAWPALCIEPGRSIVAEAGITLYTVGSKKPVPGHDPYVLIDGGMADNPRPALYGSRYEAVVVNRPGAAPTGSYTLAGKACESGDVLIRELALPEVEPGDVIAVFSTGAYNHSMSSNYNRLPRPAIVFVGEGASRLVVRRETYADLIATDLEVGEAKVRRELIAEVAAGKQTT